MALSITPKKPPKRRSIPLTPQQKNNNQGKKGEAEFSKSAIHAGGIVYRLYDTKDYQEKIGSSLAKCITAYLDKMGRLLAGHGTLLRKLRTCKEYVAIQECLRAYEAHRRLMAQKQPADFLWLKQGITRYVEVKTTRNPMGLPTDNLKESQLLMGLDTQMHQGEHWYFVIGYPAKRGQDPWAYWVKTTELYELWARSQSFIPWNAIKQVGIRVPLLKGIDKPCRWDVLELERVVTLECD